MPLIEVKVPDIGNFKNVPVIELQVRPGDTVRAEDPLVTLESDKTTLEVPSPVAGTVRELRLKIGDTVNEGTVVLLLETADAPATAEAPSVAPGPAPTAAPTPAAPPAPAPVPAPAQHAPASAPPPPQPVAPPPATLRATGNDEPAGSGLAHASPSVRRFARELGVDVAQIGRAHV